MKLVNGPTVRVACVAVSTTVSSGAALEEPEGALILDACAPVQSLVGQIMVKIGASA
mgnify:CR=1 FL=1